MAFTKWSDLNPDAKRILKPDLGIRGWSELNQSQKDNIYKHLTNKGWFEPDIDTYKPMLRFAEDHKAQAICNHLLAHGGPHGDEVRDVRICCCKAAHMDSQHIFNRQREDVVYEWISYYAENLISEELKRFSADFNDLSNQYGLNLLLAGSSLILRQDSKIISEIYIPTLNYLADPKWKPVTNELNDAFAAYLKNTPDQYSACITHTVSALQAFFQVLVNGSTGKGDIAPLLNRALDGKLIPDDPFSRKIFKDAVSVLMEERQVKGDSHPKQEYANEKTARTLLNLTMVFLQHCLQ